MRTDPGAPDDRRVDSAARLAVRGLVMALVGAGAAVLVLGLDAQAPWHPGPSAEPAIEGHAASGPAAPPVAGPAVAVRHADFGPWVPTPQARAMADWVVARDDNGERDFMVLDKVDARVYVFAPDGRLLGHSPVLLGKARGDDAVPGIGTRPLAEIRDDEKTTPAGRFETSPGRNLAGEEVVWVDYDDAISMHRVRPVAASEHRLQRLATPTPEDNRISFGCINVPVAFFDRQVVPTLGRRPGVAYVIPEVRTIAQVFEQDAAHRPVLARVAPAVGGRVTTDR